MASDNSVVKRIDKELYDIIKNIANKNQISMKQASRELAKMSKAKILGSKAKTIREIEF